MSERAPFQYAILRVIPDVERGERLNAGIVLLCRPQRFLAARIQLDAALLLQDGSERRPGTHPGTSGPGATAVRR